MVLVVNGRGRDRLVELVKQGSIGTFQLVDAAGLLLDAYLLPICPPPLADLIDSPNASPE